MKRRLCEASLAKMEFTLARQETVSEKPPCSLQSAALVEVLLVGDEDVPDQVRMIEQIEVLRADAANARCLHTRLHRHHHGERIACNLDDGNDGPAETRCHRTRMAKLGTAILFVD